MYKIVKSECLADKIYLMDVEAPRIARACQPGEFVIVKMDEVGERIPLTICDYDREKGLVTIVFQIVGASTERMAGLKAGDSFADFVGPLGQPSEFVKDDLEEVKKRRYLFVAGGVGSAPVYPQVKWLKERGIDVDVVEGAKTKDMLILEEEMRSVAGNLYITTDDGSYVRKGHGNRCCQGFGGEPGQEVRCLCCHRTYDYDEICLQAHQGAGNPNHRQHEPNHGGRHRNVRRLPCKRWRGSEVRMCGRS